MTHTTPGTRRTWSTGRQWAAHLRDLIRRLGTRAKVDVDLEAHLVACSRDFLRTQPCVELEALRRLFDDPKVRARIVPPRGARAGSPYELIVNEVHNILARVRAHHARNQRRWLASIRPAPVQLTFFPLWTNATLDVALAS